MKTAPPETVNCYSVTVIDGVRGYELARELGAQWRVLARVLGLSSFGSMRRLSPSVAADIRNAWSMVPPDAIAVAEAAIQAEDAADQARDEAEHPERYAPELLTSQLIRRHFAVQPATVRKWVQRGYLSPVDSAARPHVFSRSDVQRAIDATKSRNIAASDPARRGGQSDRRRSESARLRIERTPRIRTDELVDSETAATLVNVSPGTIRAWVSRGHLKPSPFKDGRKHLYVALDVIRAARLRA